MQQVMLSWSGGKDSALALTRLQADPSCEVVGLVTTVTTDYDRVSVHGVRRSLLHRQAESLNLPLHQVEMPAVASNEVYEAAWQDAMWALPAAFEGATAIAYGDIFLEDVKAYRERQAASLGFEALFPLWGEATPALAQEVIASGLTATLVCVDTTVLSATHAGRRFDTALLTDLPQGVDPCGERGEFHTFVSWAPGFRTLVDFDRGETVLRDGRFAYRDLL